MNYYIDFDNTLYETANLTKAMLNGIAEVISKKTGVNFEDLLNEEKEGFNSSVDNIFSFSEKMADKYKVNRKDVLDAVNNKIDNGQELVFEDAKRFIEKLKEKGNKIFILTYIEPGNQEYQLQKLMGSGLTNYFDAIIITSKNKFTLDIDYTKGIFIDDNPKDLNGLFEKNPIKVIRIRKPNNKRSKIDMDNKEIEEYVSFDDIKID